MLLPALASALIGGTVVPPPESSVQAPTPLLLAALTVRTLPAEARRGKMQQIGDGIVLIDNQALRLAPAAQIRNEKNLIVMPSTQPLPALVRYLIDNSGAISRIWILTPEEASLPR